jgi:hypothetical protein
VKATRYIVLTLGLALGAATALAEDTVGVVKRAKGDVMIERAGQTIKAEKGTPLQHGDHLTTGKGAYAYVDMHAAAPLAIGPDTTVAVDRFAGSNTHLTRRSAPRLLQSLASYLALNRQR